MRENRLLRIVCATLAAALFAATCVVSLVGSAAGQKVRVGALRGPTALGLAQLMATKQNTYDVTLASTPDEMAAMLVSGQVDIAAMPTNMAAALYNRTAGNVQILALNTLGVLYVLERGESVQEVAELAGKTLWATGQGTAAEYTLNYILEQRGLASQVEVTFAGEHAELATLAAAGRADLVMLPEPHVSALLMRNDEFRVALDITQVFADTARQAGEPDMALAMGCWVVRRAFAQENPQAVEAFLRAYEESAAFVDANVEQSAQWIAEFGIIPQAEVAARALPNCHIVSIAGPEMREKIEPLFGIWFAANPRALGGELPGDDFYYDVYAKTP
ncbi:MAG: ABC transporter substrate-binding protein [Clostridia bacterium]|nr:ABC transporter substrate-binding protein [Clostridia bacterium]